MKLDVSYGNKLNIDSGWGMRPTKMCSKTRNWLSQFISRFYNISWFCLGPRRLLFNFSSVLHRYLVIPIHSVIWKFSFEYQYLTKLIYFIHSIWIILAFDCFWIYITIIVFLESSVKTKMQIKIEHSNWLHVLKLDISKLILFYFEFNSEMQRIHLSISFQKTWSKWKL